MQQRTNRRSGSEIFRAQMVPEPWRSAIRNRGTGNGLLLVINIILPATARSAEAFTDRTDQTPYPEEMATVANAVDKRRREFATGRSCARDALRELGIEPGPILAGERGMPRWPPGVVGSTTHCAWYL